MASHRLISALAIALVGCPAEPDGDQAPSKSKPAPAATIPTATIPTTADWRHVDVAAAKLSLQIPTGAKFSPAQSGMSRSIKATP